MAGHSKFKNIMYRKGAQDSKRAKVFTKLGRELTIAVKTGGEDKDNNPRLRTAISAARAQNMPKDIIARAIQKGLGMTEGDNYEEMRYEGYGSHGVAIIIEALTDNRNRTAAHIRSLFNKYNGSLGEDGSVSFQFQRLGWIVYPMSVISEDEIFELALHVGGEDVVVEKGFYEVIVSPEAFNEACESLETKLGQPESATIGWKPVNTITIDDVGVAQTIMKLINALEDSDDVQNVWCNQDFSDEIYEELVKLMENS